MKAIDTSTTASIERQLGEVVGTVRMIVEATRALQETTQTLQTTVQSLANQTATRADVDRTRIELRDETENARVELRDLATRERSDLEKTLTGMASSINALSARVDMLQRVFWICLGAIGAFQLAMRYVSVPLRIVAGQ